MRQGAVSLIRWTHGLINRTVMVLDAALLLGMAGLWRCRLAGYAPVLAPRQAALLAVVAAVAFVTLLAACGFYRVESYRRLGRSARDIALGLAPSCAIAALPLWAFAPAVLHRPGWLLAWAGTGFLGLLAQRQAVRLGVHAVYARDLLRRRVAIVGATPDGEALADRLLDPSRREQYELVGVFDDRGAGRRPAAIAGRQVVGSTSALIDYAQHHPVDLIVVALPWDKSMAIFRLIEQVQWISADVVVPFGGEGFRPHMAQLNEVAATSVLQLMHRPFKGTQGVAKVLEDYGVAAIALLAAAPVMLLAAIALRLEGKGPVLFRQARIGYNGRPFSIYKFRTMSVDPADDGSAGTDKHDPRITRVGRFLRRSSIDELPQLLNVLRGEMSIVGPRPHVPRMLVGDETYKDAVRWYAARHRIKPGITGWAQINGMRGGIHSVDKAERGADLDLHYIKNWSLGLDLAIMFRTLLIGMFGRDVF